MAERLPSGTVRISHTALVRGGAGELRGAARWRSLAARALDELQAGADEPIVIASCNGGADGFDGATWRDAFAVGELLAGTRWARPRPVASASCASGMQALAWAAALLDGGAPSVIVLGCDVVSAASQANFEVLRVAAAAPAVPWQGDSPGFVAGEVAAAVRLVRAPDGPGVPVFGPRLAVELGMGDDPTVSDGGIDALVAGVEPGALVIGQGTGPALVDDLELATIARFAGDAPLACVTYRYGHTLGASSLLGLVLAVRGARTGLPPAVSRDGRRLVGAIPDGARATIVCRALGGHAGVLSTHAPLPPLPARLVAPRRPMPAITPAVRAILDAAPAHRPATAPAALVCVLEHPLQPPERAFRGDRMLPSAVLEITPGFVAVAVARAWGYTGPALALVADGALDEARAWIDALAVRDGAICVLYVRGDGDQRELVWTAGR